MAVMEADLAEAAQCVRLGGGVADGTGDVLGAVVDNCSLGEVTAAAEIAGERGGQPGDVGGPAAVGGEDGARDEVGQFGIEPCLRLGGPGQRRYRGGRLRHAGAA